MVRVRMAREVSRAELPECGLVADCARTKGGDGEGDEDDGDDRGGMEDLVVVRRRGGVVEEEVVLRVEAGEDRHVDLYEAALVGGGNDVEGGQG